MLTYTMWYGPPLYLRFVAVWFAARVIASYLGAHIVRDGSFTAWHRARRTISCGPIFLSRIKYLVHMCGDERMLCVFRNTTRAYVLFYERCGCWGKGQIVRVLTHCSAIHTSLIFWTLIYVGLRVLLLLYKPHSSTRVECMNIPSSPHQPFVWLNQEFKSDTDRDCYSFILYLFGALFFGMRVIKRNI